MEHNKALCMLSVLIKTQMLQAAVKYGVKRCFFSSSTCVYNGDKQKSFEPPWLREEDAYPALLKVATAGENCFPKGCAGISGGISACILV